MPVAGKKDTFALSLNQINILHQEEAAKGTAINNIASTVRFIGNADPAVLSETVKEVIRSDVSLRIALTEKNGMTVQYHADFSVPEIPVLDFSASEEAYYVKWAESRAKEPIFALDAPLFRFFVCILGENTLCLFVCTHHIISDGRSHISLCSRIANAYVSAVSGKGDPIPETYDYAEYVEDEKAYLASGKCEADREYWKNVLSSCDAVTLRPMRGAAASTVGTRKSFPLPETLNSAVYAYCMNTGLSPFGLYYAALAACLRRGGCGERITIGVPVVNRRNFRFRNTTGMFVSTLPFTCDADDTLSLNAFCERFLETWTETLRHERFPFSEMVSMTEESGRLFHIMLSFQNGSFRECSGAGCQVSGMWHYCGFQNEQLCVQLTDFEGKNEYTVYYDWLVQLFTEKDISDLHTHVCRVLSAALENPDRPLCDIGLADSAEKERTLCAYNASAAGTKPFVPPYRLFCDAVAARPDACAVIHRDSRTTYAELAGMAGKIAAAVGKKGKLCAVLLPKCVWTYAAMMGILQAGSAFCSVSTDQPEERIRSILQSSGADVLFTDAAHAAVYAADASSVFDVGRLSEQTDAAADVTDADLAYVVYTSGSTGTPKGVEISCGSFVNFCQVMSGYYGEGAVLSLCNTGFDAFLLESAAAMCCGRTAVLADDAEKDNPSAIASLMERYGTGFLALTPSRMQALLRSEPFRRAAAQLKTVICGGEGFPSDLLRSLKKNTGAAVYNQYGPSEATVAVSMARLDGADRITAGTPLPGCRLYVLDSCMHPLPENVTGELYIGGVCVGKGYRNAPEQTEKSFLSDPFFAGGRLYRTGDAARWNSRGEIEILGRKDAQVKLRGLRVEPQEISSCIAGYPGVKAAAVKAAEWNGQTVLFGYYVAKEAVSETDLLAFCATYLPRYMIPARILRIDSVPLTPNGKTDEKKLPVPKESGEILLPANRAQAKLLEIFRRTLKNGRIHAGSDYFLSGGNSLSAMETLAAIEDEFGVRMPVSALNACRTVVLTEQYLRSHPAAAGREAAVRHAPESETHTLSATQKSIYFESVLDGSGRAYLMPCSFGLPEDTDVDRLCAAFEKLVADDPIFRTSFVRNHGGIEARIADSVPFVLHGFSDAAAAEEAMKQPFDLAAAPLLRAGILEENGRKTLYLCIHHIICDGLSVPVLLERLDAFYRGGDIPDHLTFADAGWLSGNGAADLLPGQKEYWKEKLTGCPAYTDLCPDYPRPAVFDGKGAAECVHFGADVKAAADVLCNKYGITEYMLFAGIFGILFTRLCGEKTAVIGTPVAGRRSPGFDRIVGPLMRTMPLRLDVFGTPAEYFGAVRASVTEMIDNADCSVTDIAELLGLPHTRERNPLYQILFQMRPVNPGEFLLDGKKLTYAPIPTGIAKLDLYAEAFPEGDGYGLQMEYASSVYLPETVRGWAESVRRIVLSLAAQTEERPLNALGFAPDPADADAVPFEYRSLQEEIHGAALRHPEKTALIWHGNEYSFAALETLACRFARQLREAGVRKGDRVGIVMQRSPQLFAGLLAILRCGAAYVPFLNSYPADRIQYMMQTARVRCVLCDAVSRGSTVECGVPVIAADETAEPDRLLTPSDPAGPIYVLFTSGSTGRPKGVQLPQRALSNLLWEERKLMADLQGPVLCSTTCTFDIFSTESILALAQGFTVILADDTEMLYPWMLADLHRNYLPQITQYTPSRLEMCLKNAAFAASQGSVRFTILVGENVSPELVSAYHRHTTDARLVNMYGPTEAAVYVTAGNLYPEENVTVGTALGNCRLYVLDEELRPVLPGQKGELYIAGTCLADGYISQPELTDAVFTEDPFFPGERMYRSGDIFRLRADGRYECFGRRDGQIKINGIRVETGEINAVLVRCGAERAVTVVTKNADGSSRLAAAVTPETLDVSALRRSAAELLPAFMIPSVIAAFADLPYNVSGKADMPQIRRMLEKTDGQEKTEDAHRIPTETEKIILDIWEKTLGRSGLRPEDSFFEQGGTSLSALNVISEYDNRGMIMTMEDFFAHPTAQEQAALLEGKRQKGGNDAIGPKTVPHRSGHSPLKSGDILLTGATGYLGAHLVRELLQTRRGQIVCLLRDGSRERLSRTLGYYFGEQFSENGRIEVIRGDILQENLGLSPEDARNLASRVTLVIHAAADVRHFASDDVLLRTNIEGTEHVSDFALQHGMELAHISTASICGDWVDAFPEEDWIFSEDDFDIGQNRENRYIFGKMCAEQKIFDRMEKGLSARIFRVGRLIGRYDDGKFQRNAEKNAAYRVIQGLYAIGGAPECLGNLPVEMIPVDVCAREIAALLEATSTVYHIVQAHPLPLREILPRLRKPVRILPDEVFLDALHQAEGTKADYVGSLLDFVYEAQKPMRVFLSSEKTRMLLKLRNCPHSDDFGHALDNI